MPAPEAIFPLDGGCDCRQVRYRMQTRPLVVHCSHSAAGAGPIITFVRVGTLDEPDRLPPDIHIFTASKQPWVVIPAGMRAVPEYYERDEVWSQGSLQRRQALLPAIEAYLTSRHQSARARSGGGRAA